MSVDVSATAHGRTWQHTRSFSNSLGTHAPAFNGHGWCVPIHFEYLIMGQDENGNMFYALVVDGNQVIWFGKNPGEESTHYIFADDYRIVASGGDVTVFMPDGSRAMFYGPSEDQPLRGKLRSRHDPGGLDSVYVYENGRLSTMTQTIGGASVKFLYEWIEIPQAGFRLANVALEIDHQIVAAAYYEYHLNGSLQGRAGDLRRVQRARLSPIPGGGIENVGDSWYTYHLTDFRGLKFALEQEALARVRAANIDPATVTNFTTFADFHFEYDSSGRVTSETVKGGAYTYTFDYFSRGAGSGESSSSSSGPVNPYPTEFNSWRYGTIETRPDGTKNTIYCNAAGQTMLHVFSSGANDWLTGYRFGEKGRVIRKAESSAIASYDPADDGLFTLRDDSGLIRDFTDTFPTSDPDGVVKITTITVREGRDGAPVKVRELGYAQPVADWGQKYALARDIVYQGEADGGSVPSTTRWVRQYAGTLLALQSETLWPAVPAAQNGSGASDARVQVFNTRGQVTWEKDERGYISHWVYDSSGRLLKSIADVNTGSPSASDPAPNGWQSRSDGGLHLVTDYLADALGRTTLELGPAHSLPGITATVRRAHWTVYRDSIHERYEASGYLQGGTATLINPVHVSQFDLNGRLIAQIEAIRASTSEPIAPGESFPQSTWARWTATIYDNQSHLAAQRVYHAIPTEAEGVGTSGTHYAETQFGYDAMGRRNRVRTPMGTITRTVFHPRGWEQSTWVGTNDTGSTDADPTGGTVGAANGNNMVKIAERTHDGGAAGGDGHLTRTRLFLADTVPPTPGTARTTDMTYDFRGRRLATDGEMDFYESYLSDNVGRVLAVERRDTDASGNLFARTETRFDARGRVYESRTYGIDPANPPAANVDWETVPKVSALTWYNATGSVIKRRNQEGAGFEKMTYDSLGRTSRSAITIDASETGYSAALTLDGDTVLEQTEYVYDAVGNVRFQRVCERDHDATGTGSLTGPPGVAVPHSRISCRAFYYDGLGRQVATANYGTHGGSEPAHTNDVPTSTDTCLVNRSNYDSRGDLIETIDPMGIVTRSTFDAAGRLLKTVENYWPVPGETASDKNRTTEYTYNLDGKLTVLTAHNAATGPQLTRYVYGTTLTDPGVASFELLRAKIYPDSDDTISPLGNGPDGIYDRVEYSYNRLGELIGQKDQNGTVHAYDHDALGRLIHDRVTTLGTGIDDAIQRISRSYEVRGLLARVSSCSNPDPNATTPSVVNEVLLQYNAFGKLIAEYQEHSGAVAPDSTPKVLYNYSAGATNSTRLLSITYPNGRVISYDYGTSGEPDALLGRVREIRDGSTPLARYTRRGTKSTVRIEYPEPQIELTYIGASAGEVGDQYTGLDRFNRIADIRWLKTGTTTHLDRIQYGFDLNGNRTWRKNLAAPSGGFDESYTYDGLQQLTDLARGDLNSGGTGIEETPGWEVQLTYDPTGNWQGYVTFVEGDEALVQSRSHNSANEILTIDDSTTTSYDAAGNMLLAPGFSGLNPNFGATWDAWNRLVSLIHSGEYVIDYRYDGLNRRIERSPYEQSGFHYRHFYYSDQWQVLEERIDSGTAAERQFVWGLRYVDDLILRDRLGGETAERLYATHDQWHVTAAVAVIEDTTEVVERYAYEAFGGTVVHAADYTVRTAGSDYEWETRFGAYRWDWASGLYAVRYRYLHSGLGRWLSRDPFWEEAGINLFAYISNNAINSVDPLGLLEFKGCNNSRQNQLRKAFNDYCGRINDESFEDCLCIQDNGKDRRHAKEIVAQLRSACRESKQVIVCGGVGCKGNCGFRLIFSKAIHICPSGFDAMRCDPLGCTLFHEITHRYGNWGETWPRKVEVCLAC